MYEHENDQHISRLMDLREEEHVQRKQKSNSSTGNLPVSQPGDASENEAETIAKKVSDGEHVSLNSTVNAAAISTKSEGGKSSTSPGFESQLVQAKGSGDSMDESTRSEMESKMGADFSGVKIHNDITAQQMSADINAKAFTHGQDIYFGSGNYNPQTKDGQELLAHELVHTKQQNGMVRPMIQRNGDEKAAKEKYGYKPNETRTDLTGDDVGSMGYLPNTTDFIFSTMELDLPQKVDKVKTFVNEFWSQYQTLVTKGLWFPPEKVAETATKMDPQGIYLQNYDHWTGGHYEDKRANWSEFKTANTHSNPYKRYGYASMVGQPVLGPYEKAMQLLNDKQKSEDDFTNNISAYLENDISGNTLLGLMYAYRQIGTHVNRLFAASTAADTTGMDFNEVMALYGQEGYFTMPASAKSLKDQVPLVEQGGISIVSSKKNYNGKDYRFDYDMGAMNLVVRKKSELWQTRTDADARKLGALTVFSVQIAGLDVASHVGSKYVGTENKLAGLAEWSYKNRQLSKRDSTMPKVELDKDEATLKQQWKNAILGMTESSKTHRQSGTIADLDEAWVYAPEDPAGLVSFILTEAAFLLKAYQNKPNSPHREGSPDWFGTKSDKKLPFGVAYLMYNTTGINNDDTMQDFIVQAVQAVRNLTATPGDAKLPHALTEELKTEVALLTGTITFNKIMTWVNEKPERWDMLMTFMENAGQQELQTYYYDDGKKVNNFKKQVNASNIRTLSEFYKKVIGK